MQRDCQVKKRGKDARKNLKRMKLEPTATLMQSQSAKTAGSGL
jgi:hypothetical protein